MGISCCRHVISVSMCLLFLSYGVDGRGWNRNWGWNNDLLEVVEDLDDCPNCLTVGNANEEIPKNNPDSELKRTRKNYSALQESCECTTDMSKWYTTVLAPGLYPRSIIEIYCTADNSCRNCNKPYVCEPHRYDIYVLKRKKPEEKADDNIPSELQSAWKFEIKQANISCKCTKIR